jgi:hypothetical protein
MSLTSVLTVNQAAREREVWTEVVGIELRAGGGGGGGAGAGAARFIEAEQGAPAGQLKDSFPLWGRASLRTSPYRPKLQRETSAKTSLWGIMDPGNRAGLGTSDH